MKIIDTNILNKFVEEKAQLNLADDFYVTEDIRNEIENLKSIASSHAAIISKVKFVNAENHRYFDEAKYLENYKRFINKHNKIVSFYGLKGLGDISILAYIDTILKPKIPSLFDSGEEVEVFTHDQNLKDALKIEFDGLIIISDPVTA